MRILMFCKGSVLLDRGTPIRNRSLARTLSARGDVDVKLLSRDASEDVQRRVDVDHLALPDDRGGMLDTLRGSSRRFRPDIVYGLTHASIPYLARLDASSRAKCVVDVHGHRPAELLEQRWRPWPRRVLASMRCLLDERVRAGRLAGFTVVGEALARRMRRLGKPVEVVWGGVDPRRFAPVAAEGGAGEVHVVYAGNFRPYQGVGTLLKAAKAVISADEPYRFSLIGDIAKYPEVLAAATKLRPHVEVVGPVPYAEVSSRLGGADILVIPRHSDRTARYGFASKLPEYMAMGKAVVVTDVGEQARVVDHLRTGLVVRPGSSRDLVDAMRFLKDADHRTRLGRGARAFAERTLSWDHIGERLVSFLARVGGR